MRIAPIILCALMMLSAPASAQKPSSRPRQPSSEAGQTQESSLRGPLPIGGAVAIGDRAPDFLLESATGKDVRLSKLRGDWVLLVFADRGQDVADLHSVESELKVMGARIVAVCREKAGRLKAIAHRDTLGFTLLADFTGEISALYGLYDRTMAAVQPGFIVIDRRGVVRVAVLGQQLTAKQIAAITHVAITGME